MHEHLQRLDIIVGILAVVLFVYFFQRRRDVTDLPLPPGPRRLPLIHNLLDLPKGFEAGHWAKHKELYGPISSVSVLGTVYIIINDVQIGCDLLEKRSAIYSDRPSFTFGGEMVGFKGATTFLQHGPQFRLHRREFARLIGSSSAVKPFVELEQLQIRRFLLRLLDEPNKLTHHIRTLAGAIILNISHGYAISVHGGDPFVDLADRAADIFSSAHTPGAFLVDIFPFLQRLPAWAPGMGFKKIAETYAKEIDDFLDKPFAFVKHQMNLGMARPSMARSLIERNVADDHTMKWIASTLYGGGADTTVSAVSTFFLAMVLHPESLKKAQEELDRVVGRDRLPTLSDRPHLPYIEALQKETLRWNNVVPMGVPHALSQDDTYMGYKLPKGAVILPNIWQMLHEPSTYPDPFTFQPERFLGGNPQPDPRSLVFGFGRRVCPGKELADVSVFLAIAMIAATFNVGRARDAEGREILPVNECSAGVNSHPKPFDYALSPRDERVDALIRSVLDEHPIEESDAEVLKNL